MKIGGKPTVLPMSIICPLPTCPLRTHANQIDNNHSIDKGMPSAGDPLSGLDVLMQAAVAVGGECWPSCIDQINFDHVLLCARPAPFLIATPSALTTTGAAQQPAGHAEDAVETAGAEDQDEFAITAAPLGLSGRALEELQQARARHQDMQHNPTSYAQPPKPAFKPPPRTLQSIGLPADPSKVSVAKDEVSFVVLIYQVRWCCWTCGDIHSGAQLHKPDLD